MEYTKADWNEDFKLFKKLFSKEKTFNEGKELFLKLHNMIYNQFEHELWDGLTQKQFREKINSKKRTVAYGLWHSTRIADMCMNLLIAGTEQIIDTPEIIEGLNSTIYSTGNELTPEEIIDFSAKVDMEKLKEYRFLVANRTREIVENLTYEESKKTVLKSGLDKIKESGAVSSHPEANWLLDYWANKTAAGIIFMPATRHLIVHLNESLKAKSS